MQGLIRRAVTAAALIGAAVVPALALGASVQIQVQDDVFNPDKPQTIDVESASHQWQWGANENEHNVRQNDKLFYSGQPAVDDNLVFIASAGTFPYYCEEHGSPGSGMDGVIRIRPRQIAPAPPSPQPRIGVRWGHEDLATGNQFDVQYRINDGDWKSWRKNTSKLEGVFGQNGNPVEVNENKTYRFRARSELAANPDRASKFSPPMTAVFGD